LRFVKACNTEDHSPQPATLDLVLWVRMRSEDSYGRLPIRIGLMLYCHCPYKLKIRLPFLGL
jgi:hypothetical protein